MKRSDWKLEHPRLSDYYAKVWLVLEDGGSNRWKWVACNGLTFIFIRIDDMPDACGREAQELWAADVSVVDLASVAPEEIAHALSSVGYDEELDFTDAADRLIIADALHDYGARSPMWDDSRGEVKRDSSGCLKHYDEKSKSFRSLLKDAREAAEALFDEERREEVLDTRIVNRIGQTAREYAQGTSGLWDALRRIRDDAGATPEQKLVLRMYGKAGQTLGAGPVPDDLRTEQAEAAAEEQRS